MVKPYYIKDFPNAQAFVVYKRDKKEPGHAATFHYYDSSVAKPLIKRAAMVFTEEMNDLHKNNKA